ncbi:hypothetical protein [Sulfitobacter sabulilitoris]|uniref:Uncharacterized protein n=1 Tax=Sulfitobacter sabulilitoris TaxID=2562655 RepID=A0A5S3PDI2_9RHOB|nr:hypothetical protein [Sulfitobacter sabulilitoris]TMM49546.1 hypothetical protein FDT80_17495 [Sulfitobacter sabulilitoris]
MPRLVLGFTSTDIDKMFPNGSGISHHFPDQGRDDLRRTPTQNDVCRLPQLAYLDFGDRNQFMADVFIDGSVSVERITRQTYVPFLTPIIGERSRAPHPSFCEDEKQQAERIVVSNQRSAWEFSGSIQQFVERLEFHNRF